MLYNHIQLLMSKNPIAASLLPEGPLHPPDLYNVELGVDYCCCMLPPPLLLAGD